ncbi:Uncharacterised protein [Vibrio cholerae]|nr:Uncharacterised protein [Vibrio cholerae]
MRCVTPFWITHIEIAFRGDIEQIVVKHAVSHQRTTSC